MTKTKLTGDQLRERIERMVAAREAFGAQRDRLNELRHDARIDGINLQALNPLLDIVGDNRHDRGRQALSDLMTYAQTLEIDLGLGRDRGPGAGASAGPRPPAATGSRENAPPCPSAEATPTTRLWSNRGARCARQLALAMAISAALLWLLK